MRTHTVLTPSNIEIEYRLAGAGSRLAAFVIDLTLQAVLCAVLLIVVVLAFPAVEGAALGFLIISWFLIYFCYFIVCEMLMNGQSPGKKVFGLRVIRDNGQPVEFQQSLVRGMFRGVLDIVYIGLFLILFSPKCKRVGDMVAGTVVVAEHYESMAVSLRSDRMPDTSRAGMEQLRHLILEPKERELLHSYMARRMDLPSEARQRLLDGWAAHLSKKWKIEPSDIDDEILAALLTLNETEY